MHNPEPASEGVQPKVYGILAEFDTQEELLAASEKVRDAGFKHWDTHTPFPVHGIDDAMGIRPTKLPWVVFAAGCSGFALAVLMQWYMNSYDYQYRVSGKPYFSLPAFGPVMFEVTVLLSALTAFFGMFAFNLLPRFHHPLFTKDRFLRATSDKFFISIEARDSKFNMAETEALLKGAGATYVEAVIDAKPNPKIPMGFHYVGIVSACLAVVPLAVIFRARFTKSDQVKLHVWNDMDFQNKFKAQRSVPDELKHMSVFADGRIMRPQAAGTVARGELRSDNHYNRGYDAAEEVAFAQPANQPPEGTKFYDTFPIPVTEERIRRGRERFNIYCAVCHGEAGYGDGMIHKRAQALQESLWVQPTNMHQDPIRQQKVGQLFTTVTRGVRNMPAYGPQIPVEDRWAIVMYVKALQRSQNAKADDVPADKKAELK